MQRADQWLKPLTGALIAGGLAIALAACNGGETRVEAGNRTGVLHLGNGTEPRTIDPHVLDSVPESNIAWSLFEGLVTLNPKTLAIEPGVAERWEISDDRLTLTFHLRDNARWSNGDPLTADDFVWSFRRGLNPTMASGFTEYLFHIRGARDFFSGRETDPDTIAVTAPDPHTLVIELERPTPYMLDILANFSIAYPVHRPTLAAHGDPLARFTPWTRPGNFVGNGPFVLEEWRMQKSLTVRKNPHYWDAERVQLERVVFHAVENESTEERMFRVGQLHVTNMVPLSKIPEYRASQYPPYRQSPLLGVYYVLLNTHRPPLDDVRVRQALALAIDREQLVSAVLHGSVTAHAAVTPPGIPGYQPPVGLAFDPSRARQLLAEAGYPDGAGWPGADFIFNTNESNRKILVALQRMWKDELGITVNVTNMEWGTYLDRLDERDFQGARLGWIGGFLDPSGFLSSFERDNASNYPGFSDARYDEIMRDLAPAAADRAARLQLFREAEALMLDQAPVIPLYAHASRRLVHESVQGLSDNLLDYINYKYVRLAAADNN